MKISRLVSLVRLSIQHLLPTRPAVIYGSFWELDMSIEVQGRSGMGRFLYGGSYHEPIHVTSVITCILFNPFCSIENDTTFGNHNN